jgi:hypothetical protein
LEIRIAYALTEKIGITKEVLCRCERDGIDPVLDDCMAGSRKPGNAMSQRGDELTKLSGG